MHRPRSAYDDKLEGILRRSAVVFAEKGYHQASIRDVARATRVSLSGLYYYFQSKEELLFLIQDHALAKLVESVEYLLADVPDPQRRLALLIENQLRFFVEHRAEMKVLTHEADSLTGYYRERLTERMRRMTEIASDILAQLRPDSDLDPRVSVFSLFGMMNWIYTWYRVGRDVPVEEVADSMTRLFLGGYLHTSRAFRGPDGAQEGQMDASLWPTTAEA